MALSELFKSRLNTLLILIIFLQFPGWLISQTTIQKQHLQNAIEKYQKGDFDAAENQLKLLLNDHKLPDNFKIQIWNNLGNIHADQGKNYLAIQAYNKSLFLAKNLNKSEEESKILKNIGAIYMSLGRFQKAETYYTTSLRIAKDLENEKLIADCYNNLGTVYEQTKRLAIAKRAYFRAMELYKKLNAQIDIAMVTSNLAIVYKTERQIDSSIYYNQLSLKAAISAQDMWMQAAITNNIGNLYGQNRELDSAVYYLTKSLKLAKKIDALEIEIMSLESLAEAYQTSEKYQEAYLYLKRMQARQAKFNNLSLNESIDELNIRYQTKEQKIRNAQLETKQRNTVIFSIIGFCAIILFGGFLWYAKRKRLNENHLKVLNASMIESENATRMEIASDLHDHIGQKLAVMSMSTHLIDSGVRENFTNQLSELGNEIRSISHRLVPEAFRFGLVRALKELQTEITHSTQVLFQLNTDDHAFEEFSASNNLSLYRVIQELISNALKHSHATEIGVSIKKMAEHYTIIIHDNGGGFNPTKLKKSSGIGWKMIVSRIQALHGTWDIHSNTAGTEIQFNIPVTNAN